MKQDASSRKGRGYLFARVLLVILLPALLAVAGEGWLGRSDSTGYGDDSSGCALTSAGEAWSVLEQGPALSGIAAYDSSPLRCISDPYPEFNGITVDPVNNEVLASDGNTKSLLIYDRQSGNNSLEMMEPLRQIHGQSSGIGYVAGVAIDPVKREYYTVNNDVEDRLVVFSRDAEGNALPVRVLYTPHQVYGISLDLPNNELAITVQELNAILVFHKEAKGLDAPLRLILGPDTGLADPRGVYIDAVNNEIVVANHGNYHDERMPLPYSNEVRPLIRSAGRYQAPSITFHSRVAQGDQAPLRTIQGPNTQLAWPMGLHADLANDEVAVANNGDNSILIFRRTDRGDARPVRAIRGTDTRLNRPMGVYVDQKNNELWVANFGSHTINVYPRTSDGNVPPKRIIRSAPEGTPVVGFGNPMAIGYDSARQEILVPN